MYNHNNETPQQLQRPFFRQILQNRENRGKTSGRLGVESSRLLNSKPPPLGVGKTRVARPLELGTTRQSRVASQRTYRRGRRSLWAAWVLCSLIHVLARVKQVWKNPLANNVSLWSKRSPNILKNLLSGATMKLGLSTNRPIATI